MQAPARLQRNLLDHCNLEILFLSHSFLFHLTLISSCFSSSSSSSFYFFSGLLSCYTRASRGYTCFSCSSDIASEFSIFLPADTSTKTANEWGVGDEEREEKRKATDRGKNYQCKLKLKSTRVLELNWRGEKEKKKEKETVREAEGASDGCAHCEMKE